MPSPRWNSPGAVESEGVVLDGGVEVWCLMQGREVVLTVRVVQGLEERVDEGDGGGDDGLGVIV